MATGDFLTQSSLPIPAPTGQDVATGSPLWLQTLLYGISGAAAGLAQQPYNPYPGPQLAKPSADTQQAWSMAQNNVGNWKPYMDQAGALTQAAAAPITGQDISTFLNPYQNYVTGALNRNLTTNLLPSIQDKFVSAGQSRSPQEAQLTNNAIYDTQQAAGQALAGGYQGALSSLMQQRQQQGALGAQFGELGSLNNSLSGYDAGQLAATGQAQDQVAQANLDLAKNNFYAQQQWPYQQLGFLSDIARGISPQAAGTNQQTVGTTYQAPYGASPLASFIGASGFLKNSGYRQGGPVRSPPTIGVMRHLMPRAA